MTLQKRLVWIGLAVAAAFAWSTAALAAPSEPGAKFRDCANCPELIVIAPGTFQMGATMATDPRAEPSEGPMHRVTIAYTFAMGVYEVTFAEWDACVADGGCNGYSPPDLGHGRGRRPVSDVSGNDVRAYLAWISRKTGVTYRLPSEAEWEYAARAGTTTPFYTGDTITTAQASFNQSSRTSWTQAVGSYAPNGFGLYDMAGSVEEMTADCFSYLANYEGVPSDGSPMAGPACAAKGMTDFTVRGGGFSHNDLALRSARRTGYVLTLRNQVWQGFRVVRELPQTARPAQTAETVVIDPAGQHGALAIDRNNGELFGWAVGFATNAEAENRAGDECLRRGGTCHVVLRFTGGCGAYVVDTDSGALFGWGTADSEEAAKTRAIAEARARGGQHTVVRVWGCNGADEAPSTAPAAPAAMSAPPVASANAPVPMAKPASEPLLPPNADPDVEARRRVQEETLASDRAAQSSYRANDNAYQAALEQQRAEAAAAQRQHEEDMAAWEAKVRACRAGDRSQCAQTEPPR